VDNAVLVTHDKPNRVEPICVARVLSAAVRKLGGIDLVLVGREAGDWGEGQTGGLLAEELGCPCISFAEQIEPSGPAALKVRRQTDNGIEVLAAITPLVVTMTNHEGNVPRIAKTRDVMMAFRRPLTRWSLADIGLDPSSASAVAAEVVGLTIPHKESRCEFVAGETLEERVTAFAERIITVLRSA
jgi:electron transfer flavoprotein beta subunit